jgi:hypothetical protein
MGCNWYRYYIYIHTHYVLLVVVVGLYPAPSGITQNKNICHS